MPVSTARIHRARHGADTTSEDFLCQARLVAKAGVPIASMLVADLEEACDTLSEELLREMAAALRSGGDPHALATHSASVVRAVRRLIDAHDAGLLVAGGGR